MRWPASARRLGRRRVPRRAHPRLHRDEPAQPRARDDRPAAVPRLARRLARAGRLARDDRGAQARGQDPLLRRLDQRPRAGHGAGARALRPRRHRAGDLQRLRPEPGGRALPRGRGARRRRARARAVRRGRADRIDQARDEFPQGDFRARYFQGDRKQQVADRVQAIVDDLGIAPDAIAETALRYILSADAVSTVIPGMRSMRNVERNFAAGDGRGLPPEQVEKLHAHRWVRDFYPLTARRHTGVMRLSLPIAVLLALAAVAPRPGRGGRQPVARPARAQHRAPGRGGRVPLEHAVRVQALGQGRRGHARARRRGDEGRQGRRLARHDARTARRTATARSSRARSRQIRRLDAAFWFAKGDDAYSHERRRVGLQAARGRHRQAQAAAGLHARGLPRADARARS